MKREKMDKNKRIITDADGVLLDWEYAFNIWMQSHGFEPTEGYQFKYDMGERYGIPKKQVKVLIKQFNESAAIGFLPALRDAMYYVKRLHEEHGFTFEVVTSLSTDRFAQKLRVKNLQKLFGRTTFTNIKCLPTGADKDDYLKEHYEDSGLLWMEDKPANALSGYNVGMKPILVEHGHNMDYKGPATICKSWKEIYELIISGV